MTEPRGNTVYTPLRRRSDFQRLHARGQRKGDTLLQVRVLPTPPQVPRTAPIRLGILVSKKYGSAVERNRFKRIVRAALQEIVDELQPGWDILVLPRATHESKMQEIRDSFRRLLGELGIVRSVEE
ncbi:MAG: ribonuclease P protein component [Armatimonadota bacterium]